MGAWRNVTDEQIERAVWLTARLNEMGISTDGRDRTAYVEARPGVDVVAATSFLTEADEILRANADAIEQLSSAAGYGFRVVERLGSTGIFVYVTDNPMAANV